MSMRAIGDQKHARPRVRRTRRRASGSLLRACAAIAAIAVTFTFAPAAGAASDEPSPVCSPRSTEIPTGPATQIRRAVVAGTAGRLLDVTLHSPALAGETHVDILLPRSYDSSNTTRYPVLYLLHGAAGTYSDWYTAGDVINIIDKATASEHLRPFITVMPDGGKWGWYDNWYGTDVDGLGPRTPPGWATYHIDELIPWVDSHFRTVASRDDRAIAGLSMGGFGAMSYAARFPQLFAVAGSFSGAVNPDIDYPYGPTFLTGLSGTDDGDVVPENCVWGDPITQRVHWEGSDPTYLANSLASTRLFLASGGGDLEQPTGLAPTDPIEETIYLMNHEFIRALDADQITHTDDFYGPGTHTWPFWQADLQRFLPWLAESWAHPKLAPPQVGFSYDSILPTFSAWGWTFKTHRGITEFTYLSHVSRSGLTVTGSGTVRVVTARLYRPGVEYVLRGTERHGIARADRHGRLRFTIDLGPSHTSQQTSFDSAATSAWSHATVRISQAG